MSHAEIALSLLVLVIASSVLLVRHTIPIGRQLGIVNRSGARTPRIGGLPVAIAFWAGIAISFALPIARFPAEVERIALIVLAGAIVVLVMLVDDAIGLRPPTKLLVQIGVASVMVLPRLRGQAHGIAIDQFNAPLIGEVHLALPLALTATILWFVATMNAINWIDGIDGLAPTVTLVAAIVLFLHTYFWPRNDPQFTISVLPLILGAALIGFLPFNWFPARITLGDAGTNFIGLTIAAISIVGGAKLAT
ncbi:MAG: undecaprenyl/decaprenyl-phosphate alpha-N-acetylglucosaminyl 1-phosphate transferase, partial [Thermomicrobiales bacterium]|nr:undecaprenyl/decaprenyl-phosphate alpha-N-acetylglucosaminyl 1-phosphate transferase [Thermomicrobiales bacterium]